MFLAYSSLISFLPCTNVRVMRIQIRGRKETFCVSSLGRLPQSGLHNECYSAFHFPLSFVFISHKSLLRARVIGRAEYRHYNKIRTSPQYQQSDLWNPLLCLIFYCSLIILCLWVVAHCELLGGRVAPFTVWISQHQTLWCVMVPQETFVGLVFVVTNISNGSSGSIWCHCNFHILKYKSTHQIIKLMSCLVFWFELQKSQWKE